MEQPVYTAGMDREQPNPGISQPAGEEIAERPWIDLNTSHDVEAWINNYDWDLRRQVAQNSGAAAGICFRLSAGGEIVLVTTSEGMVLLELAPEAEWVAPVVAAATGGAAPNGRVWTLPADVLTQLILGLSGLIAASRPVTGHSFNPKSRQRITW